MRFAGHSSVCELYTVQLDLKADVRAKTFVLYLSVCHLLNDANFLIISQIGHLCLYISRESLSLLCIMQHFSILFHNSEKITKLFLYSF